MDISTLVSRMSLAGDFEFIARNPLAQFGVPGRRYIGAEILPERTVEANSYTEEFIRYRSIIANSGTRYSPVQYKKGALAGSMQVTLANSDIGNDLTSRELDALIRILGRRMDVQAAAQLTNFLDATINVPLVERNEAMRWQALTAASVALRGDNNYTEDVAYSNPSGNRVAASAAWSNNATDPFLDIFAIRTAAAAKGFTIKRIVTSTAITSILGNNAKVQARTGRAVVAIGGTGVSIANGSATLSEINAQLGADNLPAIETYDLMYRTLTGATRFLPAGYMVFICDTARDPSLDLGDTYANAPEILDQLNAVVGYVGIGFAAGQSTQGRAIWSEAYNNKPPRVEAEGWQTSLPVITDPDAVFCITGIS